MSARIAIDSSIRFGKPCVSGTRIAVQDVLELVREGLSPADILREYYPDLSIEDVAACVQWAEGRMKEPQKFPAEWDEARVRDVIANYDGQTEDEQADEIEAALTAEGVTMVAVPVELLDEVRALIARRRTA